MLQTSCYISLFNFSTKIDFFIAYFVTVTILTIYRHIADEYAVCIILSGPSVITILAPVVLKFGNISSEIVSGSFR